jgi:DNA-binding response OmpR family regulator
MEELIVRIHALLGRISVENKEQEIPIGTFSFNFTKQVLVHPGTTIPLTHREACLLHLLIENKNEILDRSIVLKKIWGDDDFFNGRSMDVFITKLRKKLSLDPNIQIINIRNQGYKLIG